MKAVRAGGQVFMLAFSTKQDTDDLRDITNFHLARKFLQSHIGLLIYDPHVEPSKLLGQNIGYAFSNLPALRKPPVSKSVAELGVVRPGHRYQRMGEANGVTHQAGYPTS